MLNTTYFHCPCTAVDYRSEYRYAKNGDKIEECVHFICEVCGHEKTAQFNSSGLDLNDL